LPRKYFRILNAKIGPAAATGATPENHILSCGGRIDPSQRHSWPSVFSISGTQSEAQASDFAAGIQQFGDHDNFIA
jgi:hypothetical protein